MRSRADTQATVATANSTNGNGMVYRLGVRKFETNGSDDASDSGANRTNSPADTLRSTTGVPPSHSANQWQRLGY